MLDYAIKVAPWAILCAVPVALFAVLCRLNRICWHQSPRGIAIAYALIAIGWGCALFGTMDYLMHPPATWWPTFLLLGLALLSVGNAALFLADRRRRCRSCSRSGC